MLLSKSERSNPRVRALNSSPSSPVSISDPVAARELEDSQAWWDESSFWFGLHTLYDPIRVPYFRKALTELGGGVGRLRVLDLGSGAGFVAEGLADVAEVTALDRSYDSVSQARSSGVRCAAVADAERLPMPDATYRAVVASEMLEHVDDPARVVDEAARVTVTDGLFLFSTPSRTLWSRLALIFAAQLWPLTRVLPADLHDWDAFLTPYELTALLRRSGFQLIELVGIGIRPGGWLKAIAALISLKTGRIGYAEAGRRIELSLVPNRSIAMIGYARRIETPDAR